jgi:hypothetical protein
VLCAFWQGIGRLIASEADVGLPADEDVNDDDDEDVEEVEPQHAARKQMLINHFSYCAQHKMIKWPRQNKEWHVYNPNKRNI